jgi:lysophospholipase L1-like esterase
MGISRYNASGYKSVFVSTGIGGSTFSAAAGNNDWSTTGNNYALMLTDWNNAKALIGVTKPRVIIISLGTNDMGSAVALATVQSDIASLFSRLQSDFPGVDILVLQPGINTVTTGSRQCAVRQYIKAIAESTSNVYLFGGLVGALGAGRIVFNNVHPTQPGNNDIGDQFARFLANSTYSKWSRSIIASHWNEPSTTHKTNLATLIDNNLTSYLNLEFLFINKTDLNRNAYLDWSMLSVARAFGSPSFNANSGIPFDGATQYITTGWQPSVSAYKSSVNDQFIAAKIKTNSKAAGTAQTLIGGRNAGATSYMVIRQSSSNSLIYMSNDGTFTTDTTDSAFQNAAAYVSGRSGTSKFFWKNGVQLATVSQASVSALDQEVSVGGQNDAGTESGFFGGEVEAIWGGKYSGVDHAAWYTALKSYLDNY